MKTLNISALTAICIAGLIATSPGIAQGVSDLVVPLSPAGTVHLVPSQYSTIQAAIDAAQGGSVFVADGTYTGPGNRDIDFKGNVVSVYSENGPKNCIINCQGTMLENHRGVYFHSGEGQYSSLCGFTIINGYMSGNGLFGSGGGICCYNSSPLIYNCIIKNNYATLQGGGISSIDGSPIVWNCLITGNYKGGITSSGGSPWIWNCTVSGNTVAAGGTGAGLYVAYNSLPIVTDSIFWGDSGGEIFVESGSVGVGYSDIQGGWPGNGNIANNPRFVSGPLGDYYLSQTAAGQGITSPCVDAGSDSASARNMHIYTTRTDSVYDAGIVDMGYHYPAVPPSCSVTTPTTPSGPSSGQTGQDLNFSTGGSTCSNGHSVEYRFDWGDGNYSSWGSATQPKSYDSAGTYTIKAQARCASSHGESGWSGGKQVTITPPSCSVTTPTTPNGPSSGQTGQSLSFNTGGSSCSNGHSVEYRFDWGDGSYSSWGSATQPKSYGSADTYTIKAQARCTSSHTESGWSGGKQVTITPPGVTMQGRVIDAITRNWVADANISAGGKIAAQTGSDGDYEIKGVGLGTITITVTKAGYHTETQTLPCPVSNSIAWNESPYYTPLNYFTTYLVPGYATVIDSGTTYRPAFRPIKNGFHFKNKPRIDIVSFPIPLILARAYCLGMTYAAANYWFYGIDPNPKPASADLYGWPTKADTQVNAIINLQDELSFSETIAADWNVLWGRTLPDGYIDEHYETLRSNLSRGYPQPLAIGGWSGIFWVQHAVLAYKVVETPTHRYIWIYDNNYPELECTINLIKVGPYWKMEKYTSGEGNFEALVAMPLYWKSFDYLTTLHSPGDLRVTTPDGCVIRKESPDIEGKYYRILDIDDDGRDEDLVIITDPIEGEYSVEVIPDPNADPNETYTLEEYKFGEKTLLAENVEIQNVPPEPYRSIVVFPTVPCEQAVALLDYELVEQQRISRTEFEYTFRLRAANSWVSDLKDVIVQLVGEPNNTTVLDDTVKFSLIKAGTEALSDDTFKILTDRAIEGSPSDVVWKICDCKMQRRSDFGHDWTVDFRDFAALAEAWLRVGDNIPQDVYPDGKVDLMDLMIFSEEWLK